ncbi:response regulator [Paraburkholderia terrae]|uniref:Response regulator n=1 Tax=Paraburkholderia terrae TaxID=311230 RepID=A0A2I8EWY2_9BURK|nr:response regulator [Paraburkholderia terrae]
MTDTTSQTVANVLLVDDDAENLWSLQLALESDGHHVSVAGDANCALDILRRESFQLMITDYEMPGIDGAELCRLVHEQPAHAGLPIVLLSAAAEPQNLPQSWTRFFRKPARIQDLTATLDAHVAAHQPAMRPPHPKASVRAVLRCQSLPASRWIPVDAGCWP